jgi:hypothetical protein
MSDTETEETTEPQTEPADDEPNATEAAFNETPDEEREGDDETPPATEPDEPDAQAEQAAADHARVQTEKALAKRDAQLDGENTRHAKRLGEIMGEAADDLIPCPVCMDGIAGWIYPPDVQMLPPEAIARVRQVIGLPDYTTFHAAGFAIECPDCGGLGEVTTGSHVPGREVTTCETCQKAGWIRTRGVQGNGHVDTTTGEIVTGPTVVGAEEPDSEVTNLRRRGYTVIPPLNVPAG